MKDDTMYATPEQAASFFQSCKIRLPPEPVKLHYKPTIETGRSQGQCCVCLRDVAEYAARWCGWQYNDRVLLVHFECYEAVSDPTEYEPLAEVLKGRVPAEQLDAYREQLKRVRTATLGSMAFAYTDATEEERQAFSWQYAAVQEELQARYEPMLDGGVPNADAELESAALALRDT